MSRADRLRAVARAEFAVVDARSPQATDAMSSYFEELDHTFPTGFEPGDTLTADADHFDPPGGAFVVIRVDTSDGVVVVGCGGVHTLPDGSAAEVKRMWIDPEWRQIGLAGRLLACLEAHAIDSGHAAVRLDTNAALTTAIAMYGRAGYEQVERYNDNPFAQLWFEKRLP